jgi:hypothetical protein
MIFEFFLQSKKLEGRKKCLKFKLEWKIPIKVNNLFKYLNRIFLSLILENEMKNDFEV